MRLKEHQKATENGQIEKSALVEHACKEGHEPFREKSKSIAHIQHKGMRLIREALGVRALFGHIKLRPVADWPQLYIPRLATESAAGRMKSVCLLGWLAATGLRTIRF